MYPRTNTGSKKHSKKKRQKEIRLVFDLLGAYLISSKKKESLRILEFGCGNGFQIPYLRRKGLVNACDIDIEFDLKNKEMIKLFCQCDIEKAPFQKKKFDLIFSNHVIEHVRDLDSCFVELKRIGTDKCLYVFTVPTNLWLLLSIPAQYYVKAKRILNELFNLSIKQVNRNNNYKKSKPIKTQINHENGRLGGKILDVLLPNGHGINSKFLSCYSSFRIINWQSLFKKRGLRIIGIHPLLLYAPSEWPIIPTTKIFNKLGICSSALFIMRKSGESN